MKVEQAEKFQPIVITLEDKDEAAALWHIVNKIPFSFNQEYYKEYGLKGNYVEDVRHQLWVEIDPIIGDYARKLKGRFNGIDTMP